MHFNIIDCTTLMMFQVYLQKIMSAVVWICVSMEFGNCVYLLSLAFNAIDKTDDPQSAIIKGCNSFLFAALIASSTLRCLYFRAVPSLPSAPGLPDPRSSRPYIVYELDQIRQQRRG